MANKMIEKYNKIVGNTIADTIEKHTKWQNMINDNKAFNVSDNTPVAYNGVNAVNLAITSANRGYTDNRFMTRNQAEKLGFSIKDGAKATAISYISPMDRSITAKDGTTKTVKIPFIRIGYVYNTQDINGIDKTPAKENNIAVVGLNANTLIKRSNIKVVQKGSKAFYDDKNKTIVLPAKLSDNALISTYAVVATKVAVDKNYLNDSKDMQQFKAQMAAVLIVQKAGGSFEPKGIGKIDGFNTDFLRGDEGMKSIRSSAKIANFVIEGKSFEMAKTNVTHKKVAKTKSVSKVDALKKRRTNEREALTR